jgi:pimeloyl-ACP methyl ester carboxylesterase
MTALIPPEAAAGGRPVVIALHCSGSSGRQWQALEAGLGDHCAVLAPDLIGCASVGHWGGDRAFGLDDEASTIIGFIDGWSGPVHLVGHSYGGGAPSRSRSGARPASPACRCTNPPRFTC